MFTVQDILKMRTGAQVPEIGFLHTPRISSSLTTPDQRHLLHSINDQIMLYNGKREEGRFYTKIYSYNRYPGSDQYKIFSEGDNKLLYWCTVYTNNTYTVRVDEDFIRYDLASRGEALKCLVKAYIKKLIKRVRRAKNV